MRKSMIYDSNVFDNAQRLGALELVCEISNTACEIREAQQKLTTQKQVLVEKLVDDKMYDCLSVNIAKVHRAYR